MKIEGETDDERRARQAQEAYPVVESACDDHVVDAESREQVDARAATKIHRPERAGARGRDAGSFADPLGEVGSILRRFLRGACLHCGDQGNDRRGMGADPA